MQKVLITLSPAKRRNIETILSCLYDTTPGILPASFPVTVRILKNKFCGTLCFDILCINNITNKKDYLHFGKDI